MGNENRKEQALGSEDEEMYVTLTLDNDTTVECAILTIFEVGEKDYIALLPVDENKESQDGEVFIYAYSEDKEGNPILENIESDEEYEKVSEAFDELLDDAEFDELIEEEE